MTKGKEQQLALEDKRPELTQEQEWQQCLLKVKKARGGLTSVMNGFGQALEKANLAKRLTKTVKKEQDNLLSLASKMVEQLKGILMKKQRAMSLAKVKAVLTEAAQTVKDLRDESKELLFLANKVASKASTSKA